MNVPLGVPASCTDTVTPSTVTWAWTREISSSRTTMGDATARRTLSSLKGSRPITYERSSG